MTRWRPPATMLNVGLVVASLALALGAAEVAVRLVVPQQLIMIRPDIWRPADTVGWLLHPNLRTSINTGERSVSIVTDANGLRVGRRGPVEADTRILLLGDSFMAAIQVEYEESLPGLLEANLPVRLGRPVSVRNAGVGGWDPPQYYLRARSLLASEPYDLVLVALYVGNDVVTDRPDYLPPRAPTVRHRVRWLRAVSWAEFVDAWAYPVNDALETRSHLFVFLKKRLETLLMRLGLTAAYFPDAFRRSEAGSPRWDVTADICADIAGLGAARGVPTLFLLIPADFQVDRETFEKHVRGFAIDPATVDLEQPSRLLRERLEERGLVVVDALPTLRAAHAGGRRLYGKVDTHLNVEGHGILWQVVEPLVLRSLASDPVQVRSVPRSGS